LLAEEAQANKIGLIPPLAHNALLGRYFDILSNKHSNKKCVNRKTLVTSILKMLTIALLRRWLRDQVSAQFSFSFSARFPGEKGCESRLKLPEGEAN
jgi:hypothetical protein